MDHNQAAGRYNWVWPRTSTTVAAVPTPATKRKFQYDEDSWEEQAFAEDAAGLLGSGGCVWPPRSYTCSFCRREFRSAQALGGHMNVHRRDRARMKQLPPNNPQDLEIPNLQHSHQTYYNSTLKYKDPYSCSVLHSNYLNPNPPNRLSGGFFSSPSSTTTTRDLLLSSSTVMSNPAVSVSRACTANSPSQSPSVGENGNRMVTGGGDNFLLSSTRPTPDQTKANHDYSTYKGYNLLHKVENTSLNTGMVVDKEDSCGKSELSINLSLVVLRDKQQQSRHGDRHNRDDPPGDYCNSSKRRKIDIAAAAAASTSSLQLTSPIFSFSADGIGSNHKSIYDASKEVITGKLTAGNKCRNLEEIDLELRIG